ncbi:MAG: serine hydrolase domain-containing protein [Akkermansia sp.]
MSSFPHLRAAFKQNFTHAGELGAAISLWENGHESIHLCHGAARVDRSREGLQTTQAWEEDSLVPIFSATKVASASCFLHALFQTGQSIDLPIGELWPRFPMPHATVAQLLSHQIGLAALARPASIFDLDDCQAAIEATSPAWLPPQHGYHPHTFGPILDILMRELWGGRIHEFWDEELRAQSDEALDFYIGLPESEFGRVAQLQAPRLQSGMPQDDFYRAYFTEASLQHRAFRSVIGLDSPRAINSPAGLGCACPAKGGVASARGLARFYQNLMGWVNGGRYSDAVLDSLSRPQCCGYDEILMQETSFSCGAMLEPKELFTLKGFSGFGHAGAGGCHAFCIPQLGLSFAYVMNQMDFGVLPSTKLRRLLTALEQDLA